jgi:tetratricopeptide (TPR) repeat protein
LPSRIRESLCCSANRLKKNESFTDICCCLYKYFLVISDKQSMLKLAEEINEALGKFPVEFTQGELEEEVMIALDLLAHAYLETKQFDRAKQNYQKKLEVISALQSIDARRKGIATASTYHNLGLVAQELREWDDARHNYHQSLAICVEFGDQYSQASTYHNLGIVAQELRELDDAHHNYHQALAIKVEFGDRYEQAGTYGQLGLLAEDEDDLEAATKNLLAAKSTSTYNNISPQIPAMSNEGWLVMGVVSGMESP